MRVGYVYLVCACRQCVRHCVIRICAIRLRMCTGSECVTVPTYERSLVKHEQLSLSACVSAVLVPACICSLSPSAVLACICIAV